MATENIFKRWDVAIYIAGLIASAAITYFQVQQTRTDISDIRAAMATDAQARQKETNEFSVYKTKVDFLESETNQIKTRMIASDKQLSDLNANMTYVVRWVERQERQEAHR